MTTTTKTTASKSNSKPRAAKATTKKADARFLPPVDDVPPGAPAFDAIAEAIDHASTGDKGAVAFLRGVSDKRAVAFITKLDASRAEQPGIDDAASYLPPAAPVSVAESETPQPAATLKLDRASTAHVYALRTAYTLGTTPEQKAALVRQALEAFGPIAHGVVKLALRKLVGDAGVCEAIKEASAYIPRTTASRGSGGRDKPLTDSAVVRKAHHGELIVRGALLGARIGRTFVVNHNVTAEGKLIVTLTEA